jgi:hypothetical protein
MVVEWVQGGEGYDIRFTYKDYMDYIPHTHVSNVSGTLIYARPPTTTAVRNANGNKTGNIKVDSSISSSDVNRTLVGSPSCKINAHTYADFQGSRFFADAYTNICATSRLFSATSRAFTIDSIAPQASAIDDGAFYFQNQIGSAEIDSFRFGYEYTNPNTKL